MKKLLLSLALLATPLPLLSHPHVEYYTYDAMNCMKYERCNEGVYELDPEGFGQEIKDILRLLDKLEVKVYEAIPEYFVDEYRAVYYSDKNVIYINIEYLDSEDDLLELLRHEGWHAAQDCMAGKMSNTDIQSIFDHLIIPDKYVEDALDRYGWDPTVVRLEREALWAGDTPQMTVDALKVCNSDKPMWEVYEPPVKTRSWLYWNGFQD